MSREYVLHQYGYDFFSVGRLTYWEQEDILRDHRMVNMSEEDRKVARREERVAKILAQQKEKNNG